MKCGLCASCKLKSQLFSMIFIFYSGHVCGTYHEGYQSIRRTEELCDASNKCPYRYNSTNQFKCKLCFAFLFYYSKEIFPNMKK